MNSERFTICLFFFKKIIIYPLLIGTCWVEFKTAFLFQVQWEVTEDHDPVLHFLDEDPVAVYFDEDPGSHSGNQNRAILLTVGFLPGLKVAAIPLFQSKKVKLLFLIPKRLYSDFYFYFCPRICKVIALNRCVLWVE